MRKAVVWALLFILIAPVTFSISAPARADTGYDIEVVSDTQYVEIVDQIYGGKVRWTIVGDLASHLRSLVYQNWDENSDWRIDLTEASHYFKRGIEPILETEEKYEWRLIGTVNVTRADPLHDNDPNGILYEPEIDVAGLIGDVNATGPIQIRLLFRGRVAMDGAVYPYKIALIPFLAAYRGNFTLLEQDDMLKGLRIKYTHKEAGVTFNPYVEWDKAHTMAFRLIIGEFLMYENTVTEDVKVPFRKTDFTPMESPLVLFIVLLVGNSIANRLEYMYYRKNIAKGLIFKRRKQIGRVMLAGKIALLLLYLTNSFGGMVITGSTFVLLTAVYVGAVAALSSELYGHRSGEARRTRVPRRETSIVIDDVYLITTSGILIHHATRRLHPEIDEDILSSMLVAIQDFVKDVFRDESDFQLKKLNFGDKEIYIERGKYLVIAAVMGGKMTREIEERIRKVLFEIEERYEPVLERWDGNVEAFRGVGKMLEKIWAEEEEEDQE